MNGSNSVPMLALIVGGGCIGAFVIVRYLRGARALIAWALWLSAPFVALGFTLAAQLDPRLTQQQANYNFSFGFVLLSIFIAVPWLPANLVGGLIGLWLRKPVRPTVDPVTGQPLPDWRRPDDPMLSLDQLGALMRDAAALAGGDPARLPDLGPPPYNEGEYLNREGPDYVYGGFDRGHLSFHHRSSVADGILYRVFVDQAFLLATERLAGGPDADYAERLAAEMRAILATIDPAWGSQFAYERANPKR